MPVSEGRLALTPAVPSRTSPSFPTSQQSLSLTFLAVLLTCALWEGQPGRALFLPSGLLVTEYLAWVLEGRIHRWWRPSACPACCPSAEGRSPSCLDLFAPNCPQSAPRLGTAASPFPRCLLVLFLSSFPCLPPQRGKILIFKNQIRP